MHRIPTLVPLFTILFFVLGLTGNVLIADPIFSSLAFAQQEKKEKKDKSKKGLRQAVSGLQDTTADLQNQINTIELTPEPQGETGIQGPAGPAGINGAPGSKGKHYESIFPNR